MKKLSYLPLAMCSFLWLAFTGNPSANSSFIREDSREVKVNDLYSMMIPEHMTEDTSLNAEASLEYADAQDELYIIVIDEWTDDYVAAFKGTEDYDNSKSVLENYATAQREACAGFLSVANELTELSPGKINGLKSYTFVMRGYVDGVEPQIFYKTRFFQGKEHLYTVMTWTLASLRDENLPEMNGMLDSFKEL